MEEQAKADARALGEAQAQIERQREEERKLTEALAQMEEQAKADARALGEAQAQIERQREEERKLTEALAQMEEQAKTDARALAEALAQAEIQAKADAAAIADALAQVDTKLESLIKIESHELVNLKFSTSEIANAHAAIAKDMSKDGGVPESVVRNKVPALLTSINSKIAQVFSTSIVPQQADFLKKVINTMFPNSTVYWNKQVMGQTFLAQVEDILIYLHNPEHPCNLRKFNKDGWKVLVFSKEDLSFPRRLEREIRQIQRSKNSSTTV